MLDEDALFDLIRRLPGKKSKYTIAAENEHSQVRAVIQMPNISCFDAVDWMAGRATGL